MLGAAYVPSNSFFKSMVSLLKRSGITDILVVFDGRSLPSKQDENDERSRGRHARIMLAKEAEMNGDLDLAVSFYRQAVSITPEMIHHVIAMLSHEGVRYMVSPYETDAQLTLLSNMGTIDCAITEDSDLLVYGCQRVLFKLDHQGNCDEIRMSDLNSCTGLSFSSEWSKQRFQLFCCLSGCDYVKNIKGIGIKTAHKLVSQQKTIERVLLHLSMTSAHLMDETYSIRLHQAMMTFNHQTVFNPVTQSLQHLTPLVGASALLDPQHLSYLGPFFGNDIARRLAAGLLNPQTLSPFSPSSSNRLSQEQPQTSTMSLGSSSFQRTTTLCDHGAVVLQPRWDSDRQKESQGTGEKEPIRQKAKMAFEQVLYNAGESENTVMLPSHGHLNDHNDHKGDIGDPDRDRNNGDDDIGDKGDNGNNGDDGVGDKGDNGNNDDIGDIWWVTEQTRDPRPVGSSTIDISSDATVWGSCSLQNSLQQRTLHSMEDAAMDTHREIKKRKKGGRDGDPIRMTSGGYGSQLLKGPIETLFRRQKQLDITNRNRNDNFHLEQRGNQHHEDHEDDLRERDRDRDREVDGCEGSFRSTSHLTSSLSSYPTHQQYPLQMMQQDEGGHWESLDEAESMLPPPHGNGTDQLASAGVVDSSDNRGWPVVAMKLAMGSTDATDPDRPLWRRSAADHRGDFISSDELLISSAHSPPYCGPVQAAAAAAASRRLLFPGLDGVSACATRYRELLGHNLLDDTNEETQFDSVLHKTIPLEKMQKTMPLEIVHKEVSLETVGSAFNRVQHPSRTGRNWIKTNSDIQTSSVMSFPTFLRAPSSGFSSPTCDDTTYVDDCALSPGTQYGLAADVATSETDDIGLWAHRRQRRSARGDKLLDSSESQQRPFYGTEWQPGVAAILHGAEWSEKSSHLRALSAVQDSHRSYAGTMNSNSSYRPMHQLGLLGEIMEEKKEEVEPSFHSAGTIPTEFRHSSFFDGDKKAEMMHGRDYNCYDRNDRADLRQPLHSGTRQFTHTGSIHEQKQSVPEYFDVVDDRYRWPSQLSRSSLHDVTQQDSSRPSAVSSAQCALLPHAYPVPLWT